MAKAKDIIILSRPISPMKIFCPLKILVSFCFLNFVVQSTTAQLGFCGGSSGDPIFTETFGAGTNIGPALPAGTTTYVFSGGSPFDGQYTISSTTNHFDWQNIQDHTPNDTNGRYLIINADFTAGEFYSREVSGLCENTSYEFSSWLNNIAPPPNVSVCPGGNIPINVKFQIWDNTETLILAEGDTGDIASMPVATWEQYALVFKTEPGQSSVVLKMLNNGNGGCGNDLALDDIVFKSCGDKISLTNDPGENIVAQCETEGVLVSTTITAEPDNSIYNSHAYQWQESSDATNWVDIVGETSSTYTTPTLLDSRYFRVKVAEDPINVSNSLCNVVSEVFSALIIPLADAPVSGGDVIACANRLAPLQAIVPDDQVVNWYDAPIGGNLLLEKRASFIPESSGTYYAEASSNLTDCFSTTRTRFTYTINEIPEVTDEAEILCENVALTINSGLSNVSYQWNTGETTSSIEVDKPGTYLVTATNANGCSATKTITVTQIDQPEIGSIVSDDENIIVSTLNEGDFEYALNNEPYQDSPIFDLVKGGLYTVKVRGKNNCPEVGKEFLHFVIPKFFSPNGDTVNDFFMPQGLNFYTTAEVQIFDRYGTLIKQSRGTFFSWDGTFNGRRLPASDYWYFIKVDDQQFKGHFALIR
jgi:gliding motility-associated-like protein